MSKAKEIKICTTKDCTNKMHARKMCAKHYNEWWMENAANTGKGAPFKDVVSYNGAHLRVKRARGAAVYYQCLITGCSSENAHEWAYLGMDPLELICQKTGSRFSTDIFQYVPLCRSHHRTMDRQSLRIVGTDTLEGFVWSFADTLEGIESILGPDTSPDF